MESYQFDHRRNVEEHLKIWEGIRCEEFSNRHMAVCTQICASLVACNRCDFLELFLRELGSAKIQQLQNNETFLRALLDYRMECQQYKDVYALLTEGKFSSTQGLLEMWDEAHYREKRAQIRRDLTPLIRYRIRQKFPPPPSILPDGKRPSSKLPSQAVDALKKWLSAHADSPYPTQADKEQLVRDSNLSLYQVKTWFANARRRLKNKKKKTLPTEHVKPPNSNDGCADLFNNGFSICSTPHRVPVIMKPQQQLNVPSSIKTVPGMQESVINVRHPTHEWMVSHQPSDLPGHISVTTDLNATRSLQVLAGVCDDNPQVTNQMEHHNEILQNVPEKSVFVEYINNDSNDCLSVGTEQNLALHRSHNDLPTADDEKEHSLWQPFKSNENLTFREGAVSVIRQMCPKTGSTSAVDNGNSLVRPILHRHDHPKPVTAPLPSSGMPTRIVSRPGTGDPNGLYSHPVSRYHPAFHPCVLPYLPQPGFPLRYPLAAPSLPGSPLFSPRSLQSSRMDDFGPSLRHNCLVQTRPPWTMDDQIVPSEVFGVSPPGKSAIQNSVPPSGSGEVAQVLLDLSKDKGLLNTENL